MRHIFSCCIFIFFSINASAADWVKIGSNRDGDVYYDKTRIDILGPTWTGNGRTYLRVPVLINYYKPSNYYTKTSTYNSAVEITLFDCSSPYYRVSRLVLSSEQYDHGDAIADWELSEKDTPWDKPGPLSKKTFMAINYLCK